MKLNKLVCASSVLIILCLTIFWVVNESNDKSDYEKEDTYKLCKAELQQICYGTGVVKEKSNHVVLSKCKENVKKIYVSPGDSIEVGMKLCKFDTSAIDSKIKRLNNQKKLLKSTQYDTIKQNIELCDLKMEQANEVIREKSEQIEKLNELLEKVKKKIKLNRFIGKESKIEYLKIKKLTKRDITQKKEEIRLYHKKRETYSKQIKRFTKKIKDKNDKLKKIKTKVYNLKNDRKECIIYATESGIVKNVYACEGEKLDKGKVLTTINSENKYIVSYVDEKDYNDISLGMSVNIISKSNGFNEYKGEVFKLGNLVEDGKYTVNVKVKDDSTENLVFNQNVAVNFFKNTKQCLFVPYDYIHIDKQNRNYVYKYVERTKDCEKIFVKCGLDDGYCIEIVTNKLNVGDIILKEGC